MNQNLSLLSEPTIISHYITKESKKRKTLTSSEAQAVAMKKITGRTFHSSNNKVACVIHDEGTIIPDSGLKTAFSRFSSFT
jgi:hypothetical protein